MHGLFSPAFMYFLLFLPTLYIVFLCPSVSLHGPHMVRSSKLNHLELPSRFSLLRFAWPSQFSEEDLLSAFTLLATVKYWQLMLCVFSFMCNRGCNISQKIQWFKISLKLDLSPAKISQKAIVSYWSYIKSMACMDPDRDLDPVQWSNEVCKEQQEQVLKPRNKLPGERIWMDFSMIA